MRNSSITAIQISINRDIPQKTAQVKKYRDGITDKF